LQDPPKFSQTGIFGLKIYHLTTLVVMFKIFLPQIWRKKFGEKNLAKKIWRKKLPVFTRN
jgi:hypothetical protein